MIFKYYEVSSFNPRLDYKRDVYHDTQSLGFFTTKEKAENKLRDWCESCGIPFEQNYYKLNRKYMTKIDDIVGLVSVAGIFFDFKDNQVDYDKDWDYGHYAAVTEKEIILDLGE